jgi:hypothetical protein
MRGRKEVGVIANSKDVGIAFARELRKFKGAKIKTFPHSSLLT